MTSTATAPKPVEIRRPRGNFADFDVVVQSWYVAARSKTIRRERARTVDLLGRRIVLWRDSSDIVRAMDARCPHLGADLGQGCVVGERLRCPFHHWEYDLSGACVNAPGHETPPVRSTRSYPVIERYGLIWLFNSRPGQPPHFDLPPLPDGDSPESYRILRTPPQRINCHPHLVIANGLDASHFEHLHGMIPTRRSALEESDERSLSLSLSGRPRSRVLARLTGTLRRDVEARFTTIGAGVAWLTISSPLRFHALFTAKPTAQRTCQTQVVLFLPRLSSACGLRTVRSFLLLYTLLHDDRRILDRLEFHRGFTTSDGGPDEPLRRYAELIDGICRSNDCNGPKQSISSHDHSPMRRPPRWHEAVHSHVADGADSRGDGGGADA